MNLLETTTTGKLPTIRPSSDELVTGPFSLGSPACGQLPSKGEITSEPRRPVHSTNP